MIPIGRICQNQGGPLVYNSGLIRSLSENLNMHARHYIAACAKLSLAGLLCLGSQASSQENTVDQAPVVGASESGAVTAVEGEGDNAAVDMRQAVVQITSNLRLPNFFQPWNKRSANAAGTGTLIAGGRVLTNAHVVAYASQIYVQGFQSAEKVSAKLLFIAPNIDLALLQIDDEEFYQSRPVAEISTELPSTGQTISVYGFPIGGNDLSTTEGVVSRIELAPLLNGATTLRIQVDAAVNPGNSGGPGLANGKLVGVVFSKAKQAESTGYLIPAEEVLAFLDDVDDGTYDGRPQWMHGYQTLENSTLRDFYQLDKGIGGALITFINAAQGEQCNLRVGDIVIAIDGKFVGQDGKVAVNSSLRVPFHYYFPKSTKLELVSLDIIRDGQMQTIQLQLATDMPRVLGFEIDSYPSYFMVGPLTFTAATAGLVSTLPAQLVGPLLQRQSPLLRRGNDAPEFEGEELVVVASDPFPSLLLKGYNSPTLGTLSTINGMPVKNLKHAAELVQTNQAEYLRFNFVDRGVGEIVFRRADVDAASEEILQDNSIRSAYSDDLRDVFDPN